MSVFDFLIQLRDAASANAEKAAIAADAAATSLEALTAASAQADEANLALAMTMADEAASAEAVDAAVAEAAAASEAYAVAQEEAAAATEESAAAMGEEGLASAAADLVDPITAVEVALVAAAAAAVGLAAALYEGISASLSAAQAHDKLLDSLSALAGGAAAGQKALETIRELETQVPESEAQLAQWAQTLMAAGTTDMSKLKDQLTAIADAEALVAGGGDKVKTLLAKLEEAAAKGTKVKFTLTMLQGTGLSEQDFLNAIGMSPTQLQNAIKRGTLTGQQIADAITKALKEKGQGALESSVEDLSTQWDKFKENISKLFEDVNVKPFLDAVKSVLSVFDQSTASGKAMKSVITAVFNEIFAVGAKVLPYIKQAIIHVVEAMLRAKIAAKPLADAFSGTGGSALNAINPLSHLFRMIAGGIDIFARITGAIATVVTFFQKLGAVFKGTGSIASDFIKGLVNGITNGSGMVWAAIKKMAEGALNTLKGVLGIHSPSVVMMQMGGHVATGFAQGIANDNHKARGAMQALSEPPRSAPPKGGGGGGGQVSIAAAAAAAGAAAGAAAAAGHTPEQVAKIVAHAIADFFERAANTQAA